MFRKRFYFSFPALRVVREERSSAPHPHPAIHKASGCPLVPPRSPPPPPKSVSAFLGTQICLKAGGSRSLCLEKKKLGWCSLSRSRVPCCRHSPLAALSPQLWLSQLQARLLHALGRNSVSNAGLAPGCLANPTLTIPSPDLSLGLPKLALILIPSSCSLQPAMDFLKL